MTHADRDGSERELNTYLAADKPDIIVPSGHCWQPRQHKAHLFGDPPDTRRCDGSPVVIDTEHDVRADVPTESAPRLDLGGDAPTPVAMPAPDADRGMEHCLFGGVHSPGYYRPEDDPPLTPKQERLADEQERENMRAHDDYMAEHYPVKPETGVNQ